MAADYTFEHIDDHPANTAPERCELCGAERHGDHWDRPDSNTGALDLLRRIAHLHETDPVGVQLMLKRIVHPNASQRELAEMLGCSQSWVKKKILKLTKSNPKLRAFFGRESKEARAQQRRRQRERGTQ